MTESKQIVNWQSMLEEEADSAAAQESSAGGEGRFFSLRSGVLRWQDIDLPDNEMPAVILDSIYENVYYDSKFDPDTPMPPACFAFSHAEDSLSPHADVVAAGQAQSKQCAGCPHSAWGSSQFGSGKGKACRQTRRLAIVIAGESSPIEDFQFYDEDHFLAAEIGLLKLPVTSVRGYSAYVRQITGALRRPPFGVATRIFVTPDSKTQFKIGFESLGPVPDSLMPAVVKCREAAQAVIDKPYQLDSDGDSAAQRAQELSSRY